MARRRSRRADPGAESGREVIDRFRDALETIADQHRGEQVLVFTHGAIMSLVVPHLSYNVRDDLAYLQFIPNAVPARVEGGDEGWARAHLARVGEQGVLVRFAIR